MEHAACPRLMVSAPGSGQGKTSVVLALLRALVRRGLRCAGFKCGPDYIDPMFHRAGAGACRSANLDLFLADAAAARRSLQEHAQGVDVSVIEGAMGYYDGIAMTPRASAYEVAAATATPVALVVDASAQGASAAAQVLGFLRLRSPSFIACVILNRASPKSAAMLGEAIERECGVRVAGYLPPMPPAALESRHLGLVGAQETPALQQKLDLLAGQAEKTLDMDLLLSIARAAPPLPEEEPPREERFAALKKPVRIAVARDEAFCFYYEETLALLRRLGAQTVEFSPLRERALPERAHGLLLGGGYPELHARELEKNLAMRESVRRAIAGGMPAIAECGGFLYLHRTLEGADGGRYAMAGVFPAHAYRTARLQRFGYCTLSASQDSMLFRRGEEIPAHEFHYWDSSAPGTALDATKPLRPEGWPCGYCSGTLYAGFAHLYLAGRPALARRFLQAAADFQGVERGEGG